MAAVKDRSDRAAHSLVERVPAWRRLDQADAFRLLEALPAAVYTTDQDGRITFYNRAAAELWGCEPELGKSEWCGSWRLYFPDGRPMRHDECPMALTLKQARAVRGGEAIAERPDGTRIPFLAFPTPLFDDEGTLVGAINTLVDMTERKQAEESLTRYARRLETLNRISRTISRDLDLERIVQTVTDSATLLSGAKFGAFFYNVTDDAGESYRLFTLSGAPREAFETFGLPRNTAIFETTFRGQGIVRSDDIRNDPRYGKNAPHYGMPKGHLPVVSYLAVPVVSRTGEVHGGLFFAHDQPGVFSAESEEIVAGIAAHAALAIDNARLLEVARVEIEHRRTTEGDARLLASIVESSHDAIVSKNLDGKILSWNGGAERLFGYSAEEMIGQSILTLIPSDRHSEETDIIQRIRRGERVDHYETIRRRKDGSFVDVSLVISPIKDAEGRVIGASKIARDITERKQAQIQQQLLLREMDHRIKNLFAIAGGIVTMSVRGASSPQDMAETVRERLGALARAHDLVRPGLDPHGEKITRHVTLHAVVETVVSPYIESRGPGQGRIVIGGPEVEVGSDAGTSIALVLHELATNAAKYGALSLGSGRVHVNWTAGGGNLELTWHEFGGPPLEGAPKREGFGSLLARQNIEGQLGGSISRHWNHDGLVVELSAPLERLAK